ncbi:hypothetical protein GCM10020366_11230 [Saccharopolyspora gregorii]|uniref:Uncharacterized protein n=1 Tax=Saccharopolyspora gregorii TaxID=33914 RepID=A0ABP6RJH3_9PSEU
MFGPDGESIGKVRDVVAGLRAAGQPPRILGLVMEMGRGGGIFVPMLRVVRVEPNAGHPRHRLGQNTRQFHQRPNEVLVLGQLLDAKVTLAATGASAVLVDGGDGADPHPRLADQQGSRSGEAPGGSGGRRGPVQVVGSGTRSPGSPPRSSPTGRRAWRRLALLDTMRAWTWPARCTNSPRSAASRWPRRSTTNGSPTSWRNCPRTTRRT